MRKAVSGLASNYGPVVEAIVALIRRHPGLFLLATLTWLPVELLPLLSGHLIGQFFDILVATDVMSQRVGQIVLLLAGIAIMQGIVHVLSYQADIRFRFLTANTVRLNALRKSVAKVGSTSMATGDQVNRIRDDADVIEDVVDEVGRLVDKVIFASCAVIVLVRISPILALIACMPIATAGLINYGLKQKVLTARKASRRATSRVYSFLSEAVSSVATIKVFQAQQGVVSRLRVMNQDRLEGSRRDKVLSAVVSGVASGGSGVGIGLALLWYGIIGEAGLLTPGEFAQFVYYLLMLSATVTFAAEYVNKLTLASVSVRRLTEMTGGRPAAELYGPTHIVAHEPTDSGVPRLEPLDALEVRDLSSETEKTGFALRGVSFTVHRGRVTLVVGETGAGKTTLLRLVLGLGKRRSGEVMWNGRRIDDRYFPLSWPHVGYSSQKPELFGETICENVTVGRSASRGDVEKALTKAELIGEVTKMESGVDTPVGPRGDLISGGQLRRLALARTFVGTPDLYVWDDPLIGLDRVTAGRIVDTVIRSEFTMLIASHHPLLVEMADQIVVLKGGRIEAIGTLKTLLTECEEMRRLWAVRHAESSGTEEPI